MQKVGGAVGGERARHLTTQEAERAMALLLDGAGTDVQVAGFLVALRSKSMTADEIAGFALAARKRLRFPALPDGCVVVGTSRLGNRHHPPLGLGSACAAAAGGAPILLQAALHARGAGTTLGDLWQGMGHVIHKEPEVAGKELQELRLACWQPTAQDSGWGRLLEIENHLGLRSAPDVVLKLLAPAEARLLVPSRPGPVLGTAGEVIAALGFSHALIVQGLEGSLDPSVMGRTRGLWVEDGHRSPLRMDPADFGFFDLDEPWVPPEAREEEMRAALLRALSAVDGPELHAVLLGAALILKLSGVSADLVDALDRARDAVESGRAAKILEGRPS